MEEWGEWIGRQDVQDDVLTQARAAQFRATLGSDSLAGLHWCLCTPNARTEALGPDGHPLRGQFLPPVPLPRRMWAASELSFHAPMRIGDRIERASRIADVAAKTGRSGRLVFVTVAHEMRAAGALAVAERQTLVYRETGIPPALRPASPNGHWDWERTMLPTPVLLFRYSALTFNSHRIHYDLPYARDVEGYDGLVVHGPLTATLLMQLAEREAGAQGVATFAFRGEAPGLADRPLRLCGRREADAIALAAFDPDGTRVMRATATLGRETNFPA